MDVSLFWLDPRAAPGVERFDPAMLCLIHRPRLPSNLSHPSSARPSAQAHDRPIAAGRERPAFRWVDGMPAPFSGQIGFGLLGFIIIILVGEHWFDQPWPATIGRALVHEPAAVEIKVRHLR